MSIDTRLTSIYNYLKVCDISFFSFLNEEDLKICHKMADYFFQQKENLDNQDINTIQDQIDKFKKKRISYRKISISDEALEAIYRRFHDELTSIHNLPNDLFIIFLGEAANFQTGRVCRRWANVYKDDRVWMAIAEKVEYLIEGVEKGKVHEVVKNHCREYLRECQSIQGLSEVVEKTLAEEFNKGAKGEMTIDKMLKLIKLRKARDIMIVWEKLAGRKGLSTTEKAKGFSVWFNENIKQLLTIDSFVLNKLQLSWLPPEIGRLRSLRTLILEENMLTTLPPETGALTSLGTLLVNKNKLTSIPVDVARLPLLTHINLQQNRLATFPQSFTQLIQLEDLNLADNQLTAIPPQIETLTRLSILSIANNPLVDLPVEMKNLQSLTKLILSDANASWLTPECRQVLMDLNQRGVTIISLKKARPLAYRVGMHPK